MKPSRQLRLLAADTVSPSWAVGAVLIALFVGCWFGYTVVRDYLQVHGC